MIQQLAMWYPFTCPECDQCWESQQSTPDREWCPNGCNEFPELMETT